MRTLFTFDVLMLPENHAPYNRSGNRTVKNHVHCNVFAEHASVDDFRYRPYLFPEIRLPHVHVNAPWGLRWSEPMSALLQYFYILSA